MNKKRLLKMADFVETIPRKQFNMDAFKRENYCGFVGCAMGWAAHKELFRGLTLAYDNEYESIVPQFSGFAGFPAAEELFEITARAAESLFLPNENHRTPEEVATNIRRFVETGKLP